MKERLKRGFTCVIVGLLCSTTLLAEPLIDFEKLSSEFEKTVDAVSLSFSNSNQRLTNNKNLVIGSFGLAIPYDQNYTFHVGTGVGFAAGAYNPLVFWGNVEYNDQLGLQLMSYDNNYEAHFRISFTLPIQDNFEFQAITNVVSFYSSDAQSNLFSGTEVRLSWNIGASTPINQADMEKKLNPFLLYEDIVSEPLQEATAKLKHLKYLPQTKKLHPNQIINRAQLAQYLVNFYNLKSREAEAKIRDVSPSHPYRTAIHTAVANGYLTLYKGKFRPENEVTKAVAVTTLVRAEKLLIPTRKTAQIFTDVSPKHWVNNYLHPAVDVEMISKDGVFAPQKMMTKGALIGLISRSPSIKKVLDHVIL
jgi:hypothetical protein